MKVMGEGASDSAQRGENCGPMDDSVGGGGIFVGHNRITARLSQAEQESRQYKNSIGTAGDVGALERWSVGAWRGKAGAEIDGTAN